MIQSIDAITPTNPPMKKITNIALRILFLMSAISIEYPTTINSKNVDVN
jgi:hypothetical protein